MREEMFKVTSIKVLNDYVDRACQGRYYPGRVTIVISGTCERRYSLRESIVPYYNKGAFKERLQVKYNK